VDEAEFRKVFVDAESGTIAWPGGIDLAPDGLHRRLSEAGSSAGRDPIPQPWRLFSRRGMKSPRRRNRSNHLRPRPEGRTMPVPIEFGPLFTSLVDKSRRSEINWAATARPNVYRVRFPDFSIVVSQEGGHRGTVRVQLLNDQGEPSADIAVDDRDDEWLGAVGLFNSAERKVLKVGRTMRRAMEELEKQGVVGLEVPTP
jgi:hypothetical protein